MLLLGLFYKRLVELATANCFIRGLSIYLPFTSFYLREKKKAKILEDTGDEGIDNKQTKIFICNFTCKFLNVL